MVNYKHCPACSGSAADRLLFAGTQGFLICSKCETIWLPDGPQFKNYDAKYIQERGHDGSSIVINNAKKRTFTKFWNKLLPLSGPILEVGCSTCLSLKAAQDMGLDVYGLDVNESIVEFAERLGIPRERISINGLKEFSGKNFEAVAFFDSFEHLPDPKTFLSDLITYLSDKAAILLVIPNGGSISRKLLGRLWPHYLTDHWVHYTLKGLEILLSNYNIKIVKTFYPIKYVPVEMIIRHIAIKSNISGINIDAFKPITRMTLQFNIGEIGLICRFRNMEKNDVDMSYLSK